MAKRKKNYLNNADLLEQVRISKEKMKNNPSLQPGECMTNELALMFSVLVDRYAQKPNWSGYSYLEELKGEAIVNLVNKWHKFDCDKYDKPFAYYTTLVERSFKGQIQKEKKPQKVKDAILADMGEMPSFAAQEENSQEFQQREVEDAHEAYDSEKIEEEHGQYTETF